MARAYVAVGSNIDPAEHVPLGLHLLHERAPVQAVSPFYETEPIDRPEQEAYWNGVAVVQAHGDPVGFHNGTLREIEAACGRVRGEDPYAARELDLDLLLWDEVVLDEAGLVLPDPQILERAFLARCLLDLDPDIVLPGHQAPLAEEVGMLPGFPRVQMGWAPP